MRHGVVLTLILFSASVSLGSAVPSLQVKFELQPETTLPGIPVSIRFTITNPTDAPINVPNRLLLLVRDSAGNSFVAGRPNYVHVQSDWPTGPVLPRSSVVREILTEGTLGKPIWFGDGLLSRPGIFQLQAWLVANPVSESLDLEDIRQRSILSNTAILTVQEPQGIDAQVWKEMLTFCKGKWLTGCVLGNLESAPFVKHIVTAYPGSIYAGWFAMMLPTYDLDERAALLRNWLSQAPDDSYTDWRRLTLAQWEVTLTDKYHQTKPEVSKQHETKARELLNALIKNTKIDVVRAKAQDRLDYLDEPGGDS